ncbi:MAG: hypothetical protein ACTS9Y_00165 [Methylophilus sp.]|uniref:hypothetical protein n=1 Tax=Methylophilus sp. TaxID=29541 RepID=UPI003F9F93BD
MGFTEVQVEKVSDRLVSVSFTLNQIIIEKHSEGKQVCHSFNITNLDESEKEQGSSISFEMDVAVLDTSDAINLMGSVGIAVSYKNHAFFIFEEKDIVNVFVTLDKATYRYVVKFTKTDDGYRVVQENIRRINGSGMISIYSLPDIAIQFSVPDQQRWVSEEIEAGDIAGRAVLFAGELNGTVH